MVEFSKLSIKMKKFKTFYKPVTGSRLKEVITPPPTPPTPDKRSLFLCYKNFLTEIYRNMQTFAFQVLRECTSWASRNGAVQIFFLAPMRNMFVFNVYKVEVRKMFEVF